MPSKAQQGAWKKGALAARDGKPRVSPYKEKATLYHRGVTFSRSFINAWLAGYDSVAAKEDRPMEIEDALWLVRKNAIAHRNKNAKLRTILAEVAELAYALDGEHEHPPKYELIQIAGICVNWITRIKEN